MEERPALLFLYCLKTNSLEWVKRGNKAATTELSCGRWSDIHSASQFYLMPLGSGNLRKRHGAEWALWSCCCQFYLILLVSPVICYFLCKWNHGTWSKIFLVSFYIFCCSSFIHAFIHMSKKKKKSESCHVLFWLHSHGIIIMVLKPTYTTRFANAGIEISHWIQDCTSLRAF